MLVLALIGADGRAAVHVQGAAAGVGTYALVDTWGDRPFVLTAGRVASPLDVTSLADGRTVILDDRLPLAYVHAVGGGGPDTAAVLPDDVHAVRRIDAGADGTLALLAARSYVHPEVVLAGIDGRASGRFDLPAFEHVATYTDVAVGPDGRIYAAENDQTNSDDPDASARIVVLRPNGDVDALIDLQRWFPVDHRQPGHVHPRLGAIDVGPDGRLFALLTMVPCT